MGKSSAKKSNEDGKTKDSKVNKKGGENGSQSNATDDQKRPGSAVSQQFLPKKQQNVTNTWRKHEEQKQQNAAPFGYVPFKNQTAPLPIYGIRGNTAVSGQPRAPQMLNPADFLHSTYAPPHVLRPDSAMVPPRDSNISQRGAGDSRPVSEMGMYLPSKVPSRYQSYTTLPRPEHVEIDDLHNFQAGQQFASNDIYGMTRGKSSNPAFYAEKQNIYGIAKLPSHRPASAMSTSRPGMMPYIANGHYPLPHLPIFDENGNGRIKEIVDWGSLNLSSCLQVLFGSCIFALGVARMFLRADYAKGILPLMPLLSAAQSTNGKPRISINGTNEPIEVDLALAILSLLQFAACVVVGVYGCRAAGTTVNYVEQLRAAAVSQNVASVPTKELS
ncbi:hypothetical protein DdX_06129 [Ditylenchus destructor]|uniref:Uncharacterized protein n=1 Tax=Ditylenchus destructor TaxID=166010 RepID=A0AAD4N6P4_9BILA|nr:hypothetical protein DdX_06129 [Ditylenchus destructor]